MSNKQIIMGFLTIKMVLTKHFEKTLEDADSETTEMISNAFQILDDLDENLSEIRLSDLKFIIDAIHDEELKQQIQSLNWSDAI